MNQELGLIYFVDDQSCVYKIHAEGNSKKQLLYRFENQGNGGIVFSILLHNGDALVTSQENKSVYIRRDGTVIELGYLLPERVIP